MKLLANTYNAFIKGALLGQRYQYDVCLLNKVY